MAYASWSVVFGEQPSAAKWNILGTNDASFNDGTGLNTGSVQQIVTTTYSAVATTTGTIPSDDSIPQIGEGGEFMTQAITPKSATNILVVSVDAQLGCGGSGLDLIGAIFQDSTANALAAGQIWGDVNGRMTRFSLRHTMVAGTTSATTFRFRAGASSASTLTFNGSSSSRRFGAITKSSIVITEHKAS